MSVFLFGARGVDGEYDLQIYKQTYLCMQILTLMIIRKRCSSIPTGIRNREHNAGAMTFCLSCLDTLDIYSDCVSGHQCCLNKNIHIFLGLLFLGDSDAQ